MEIKNTSYLRKLDPELKKIAQDYGITKEELYEIIDEFFVNVKKYIEDERMPKVQITNFGTFTATPGKINHVLRKMIYFNKKGITSKEKLVNKIKEIWPVKQRLISEKNGEKTWDKWKKRKNAKSESKKASN